MARAGLSDIIATWRRYVADAASTTWTDDDAQERLDRHSIRIEHYRLQAIPSYVGGSTLWRQYLIPIPAAIEGPESGTARWRVHDASGNTIGTADYTWAAGAKLLIFNSDQHGSARYFSGYAYDVHAAASDAWLERAAMLYDSVDMQLDGDRLSLSQQVAHCRQQADLHSRQALATLAQFRRDDLA